MATSGPSTKSKASALPLPTTPFDDWTDEQKAHGWSGYSDTDIPAGLKVVTQLLWPISSFQTEVFYDLYDHYFKALCDDLSTRKYMREILKIFFHNAEELKNEHRGKVLTYRVPLSSEFIKENGFPDGSSTYKINVVIPNEQLSISEDSLTIERFKSLCRIHFAKELTSVPTLTASASSVGYTKMISQFFNNQKALLEMYPEYVAKRDIADVAAKLGGMSEIEAETLMQFYSSIKINKLHSLMSHDAAVAAVFSLKEFRKLDADLFPAMMYWAGLLALMIDIRNNIRAPTKKAAEVQCYKDFKKKLSIRGIFLETETWNKFRDCSTDMVLHYLCQTKAVAEGFELEGKLKVSLNTEVVEDDSGDTLLGGLDAEGWC